jgi:hypothetical protein
MEFGSAFALLQSHDRVSTTSKYARQEKHVCGVVMNSLLQMLKDMLHVQRRRKPESLDAKMRNSSSHVVQML